jgi:hypothetical protein
MGAGRIGSQEGNSSTANVEAPVTGVAADLSEEATAAAERAKLDEMAFEQMSNQDTLTVADGLFGLFPQPNPSRQSSIPSTTLRSDQWSTSILYGSLLTNKQRL